VTRSVPARLPGPDAGNRDPREAPAAHGREVFRNPPASTRNRFTPSRSLRRPGGPAACRLPPAAASEPGPAGPGRVLSDTVGESSPDCRRGPGRGQSEAGQPVRQSCQPGAKVRTS
jgi:hypothetical protein